MRGKKAKILRRLVYQNKRYDFRNRRFNKDENGTIFADNFRRFYQNVKKYGIKASHENSK